VALGCPAALLVVQREAAPMNRSIATLRDRLLALRDELRQRLAATEVLDGGLLRMLADVETVLGGLDRDA